MMMSDRQLVISIRRTIKSRETYFTTSPCAVARCVRCWNGYPHLVCRRWDERNPTCWPVSAKFWKPYTVWLRPPCTSPPPVNGFDAGRLLLKEHTAALLGPPPAKRSARIMVTMPSEAAADAALVEKLLANGMDCMRINCSHDDP